MKSKYQKLTLNTLIFALGTFGSKAVSFFLVPLYTNVLSTGEYGISDLITTITGLLLPLFSISMGEAILFFGLKAKSEDDKNKYFKNGFCVVFIGCVFLVLLSPLFLLYHALDGYTWFLPAFAVFEILRTYLRYTIKSKEKNIVYSLDSIFYAIIVAVLNLLFLLVFKWGVEGYLLAYILAEFLSFLFLFIFNKGFSCLIRFKLDKETIIMMMKYSAPLILNSIMWAVSSSSDKIMLESMISSDAVGIYSAASKIPTIVNTFINFFCQAWTISTYLELENNDKKFYSRIFSLFSFVLVLATSVIMFVERPFMYIYVGVDFRQANMFVPFLLIASTFQNYSAYFGSIIQSGKKNTYMFISTVVAAALNLGLNLVLIFFYGIQGACIATAASFLIVFILRLYFSKKVIDFPLKLLRLIILNFVLILQSIAVTYNWHFVVISVICILTIILLNMDCIFLLFNNLKSLIRKKNNNNI